jgi:hypothetical protein
MEFPHEPLPQSLPLRRARQKTRPQSLIPRNSPHPPGVVTP